MKVCDDFLFFIGATKNEPGIRPLQEGADAAGGPRGFMHREMASRMRQARDRLDRRHGGGRDPTRRAGISISRFRESRMRPVGGSGRSTGEPEVREAAGRVRQCGTLDAHAREYRPAAV